MTFSNFFSDYLGNVEWLDAIIGAAVMLAIAWAWYGPLFGKRAGTSDNGSDPMTIAKGYVKFFLYGLGIALTFTAIHVVYGNAPTFETLVVTAFAVTFLIAGTAMLSSWVWEDGKIDRWAIDWGFWFVAAVAYGYVVLDLLA